MFTTRLTMHKSQLYVSLKKYRSIVNYDQICRLTTCITSVFCTVIPILSVKRTKKYIRILPNYRTKSDIDSFEKSRFKRNETIQSSLKVTIMYFHCVLHRACYSVTSYAIALFGCIGGSIEKKSFIL